MGREVLLGGGEGRGQRARQRRRERIGVVARRQRFCRNTQLYKFSAQRGGFLIVRRCGGIAGRVLRAALRRRVGRLGERRLQPRQQVARREGGRLLAAVAVEDAEEGDLQRPCIITRRFMPQPTWQNMSMRMMGNPGWSPCRSFRPHTCVNTEDVCLCM